MRQVCRRCGLPRRRTLLTPDGKTFSFPGFAVRRHRGLLLASGAALCCCCVDQDGRPTSDASNPGGWTGSYADIDEWTADDDTTKVTKQINPFDGNQEATYNLTMTDNGGADYDMQYRIKVTRDSGTTGSSTLVVFFDAGAASFNSGSIVSTVGITIGVWTTFSTTNTNASGYASAAVRLRAFGGLADSVWTWHVSAVRVLQICP